MEEQLALDILPQWKVILRDNDGKATTTVEGHDHVDANRIAKSLFPEARIILVQVK